MATTPLNQDPSMNVAVAPPRPIDSYLSPLSQPTPEDPTKDGVSEAELSAEMARAPGVNYDAAVGNLLNARANMAKMTGGSPGIISSDQARDEGDAIDETLNGMPGSASGGTGTGTGTEGTPGAGTNAGSQTGAPTGPDLENDPLLKLFNKMQTDYDMRLKQEQISLEAQRDQMTRGAKKTNESNVGAAQLALLRAGGFSAMSGQDYLYSLKREGDAALADIDRQYLDALRKARDARADMDYKIAGQMIQRAEQLQKDFVAEQQRQVDNLLKYQQIENMRADNLEKKLELMAKSGLTSKEVDANLLLAFDKEGGYAPGTTAHLLDFLAEQTADKKASDKLENSNKAIENQLKIADLISKMPAGKSFFVDGKEYFGTASAKKNVSTQVEIDENGNGTLVWINEDVAPGQPGFSGTASLGHIGSAKDNWINAYDSATGVTYRYNTQTQEANPILAKGGFANPANDPNFTAWQSELGTISQPFGVPSKEQPNGHTGTDIAANEGEPINPFFPEGVKTLTVVAVKDDAENGQPGYGNYVDLRDDQGNVWRYAHLREGNGVNAVLGQTWTLDTEKDTPIGWVGHTGSVRSLHGGNGAHLHIEKRAQTHPLSLTTPAGQDKANFPDGSTTTPLITEYPGSVNKIGAAEIAQAKAMAVDVYGKVNGGRNENVNPILEQFAMGKSFDDIKDDLRHGAQSGDLGPDGKYYQYSVAIDNGMKGKNATLIQASKDQVDDQLTRGDVDGAKDTVIRAAEAGMYAATKGAVIGQKITIQGLSEIEYLINYMEANGIDTGLLQGTANGILNKIGKIGDPYLSQLAAQALVNLQSYRASTTGKQFSQQETAEYQNLFPAPGQEFDLNTVRLNVLRDSLKRSLRTTFMDAVGEGAYYGVGLEDRLFAEDSVIGAAPTESDALWDQFVKDHPELANVQ